MLSGLFFQSEENKYYITTDFYNKWTSHKYEYKSCHKYVEWKLLCIALEGTNLQVPIVTVLCNRPFLWYWFVFIIEYHHILTSMTSPRMTSCHLGAFYYVIFDSQAKTNLALVCIMYIVFLVFQGICCLILWLIWKVWKLWITSFSIFKINFIPNLNLIETIIWIISSFLLLS